MRSSKSRSRSKSNRSRSVGNIVNRVFDSSGPEGKVRGTPQQIIEKYTQLTRDAQLSNDRVAAENFQQHAEHYLRMLGEAQREIDARREQQEREQGFRQDRSRDDDRDDDDQDASNDEGRHDSRQDGRRNDGRSGDRRRGDEGRPRHDELRFENRREDRSAPPRVERAESESGRDRPASSGVDPQPEQTEAGEARGEGASGPASSGDDRRSSEGEDGGRDAAAPGASDVIDTSSDSAGELVETPESRPARPRRPRAPRKPRGEAASDNRGSAEAAE